MSRRTPWFLLGAAVLLAVAIKWGNAPVEKAQEGTLLPAPASEVEGIELARAGTTLKLVRGEGKVWQMEAPAKDKASPGEVDGLLRSLEGAERRDYSKDPLDEGKKKERGLDAPRAILTLRAAGKAATLRLGAHSKVGNKVYLEEEGKPGFALVSDTIEFSVLKKPFDDFRDRDLASFPRDDVRRIAIRTAGKETVLEKGEKGWRVSKPFSGRADPQKVDELLREAREARIERFVEEDARDLARFGLGAPALEIEVGWGGQAGKPPEKREILLFGGQDKEDVERVYAKRADRARVEAVLASNLEALKKDPQGLRDRAVADVNPFSATEVEIADAPSGAERAVLLRKERPSGKPEADEEWRLSTPEAQKADRNAVERLLTGLRDLKADSFEVLDAAKEEGLGLGTKAVRIRVLSPAEGRVRVGERNAKGMRPFRREGEPEILWAKPDEGLDALLAADPLAFRDREVQKVPRWDVKTVTIYRDGRRHLLNKTQQDKWQLLEPIHERAEGEVLDGILDGLNPLKAERFAASGVKDGEPYGLKDPQVRLEVETEEEKDGKKEKKTWRLHVGRKDPKGGSFAWVPGEGVVFSVSATLDEKLHAELRAEKGVLSLEPSEVSKVEVRAGAAAFSIEKKGESWEGAGKGLDSAKVQAFLDALREVKADRFEEYEAKDFKPFGLEPPERAYEITEGTEKKTLHVGTLRGTSRRIRNLKDRAVALVPESVASRWVSSAEELLPPPPPPPPVPKEEPKKEGPKKREPGKETPQPSPGP